MEYKCELKEQIAQPALSVRTRTPVGNLPKVMGDSYMSIAQYLAEIGQRPAGDPFAIYHNMDMKDLDVEMGFPVTHTLPGNGTIDSTELPGGKVGTCLYVGPYNEIERGYDALSDWMVSNHYAGSGIAYEVYLNDPGETPPHELKTLIVFPLKQD
jgi:effector-binding domain-containing protein